MQLSKIRIKNYRLLINAELEVDPKTTLIVGRNNTAKTSCFSCIGTVLEGKVVSFNDYPLFRREDFYSKIALFMEKKLSYENLCKQIETISIDFLVDYSLDDLDDNLGALSPFIIDVDVDTTTALIRAEYQLKTDEKTLWALLESSYYKDGAFAPNEEAHDVLADHFGKLFGLTVYAINPNNLEDKQVKSQKELHDLFPFHAIPAERVLGEDDGQNSSLGSLISGFFDMNEGDLDPEVAEEIKQLRTIVEKANKDVQKQSDEILSAVVNSSIGFGYPNIEELKLGVTTQLNIDDQIKNQTNTCRSTVSRLMAFTRDTSMPDSSMLAGSTSTPSAWWSIASSAWIGSSMSARPMSVDSVTVSASGWGQPRLMVKLACGSQSTSRTRLPSCASPMPRLAQVVVLPTPPFWLAMDRMVGCNQITSLITRNGGLILRRIR